MVRTHRLFGVTAAACLIGLAASTWANEFPCVDEHCLPGPRAAPAAAAAAPTDEDEDSSAAAAVSRGPAMFAAPTPSGEVEGARNSYSLPSLELSIPKMSFGLPEFHIRGMGRGRREAQMRLDEGTAPLASGAPAIYGPLLGASLQQPATVTRPASAAPGTVTWTDAGGIGIRPGVRRDAPRASCARCSARRSSAPRRPPNPRRSGCR